eukprot:gene12528-15744_t
MKPSQSTTPSTSPGRTSPESEHEPSRVHARLVEPVMKRTSKVECGICLDEDLTEIGELSSCSHRFCFPCAQKWAQVDSRCPVCRESFIVISRKRLFPDSGHSDEEGGATKKLRGTVVETCVVPERRQTTQHVEESNLNLDEMVCQECNGGQDEDQLLLCDGCDRGFHTYCVRLGSIPIDEWFCCDRGFHTYCVGLGSIPIDEWFCVECAVERQVLAMAAARRGRRAGTRNTPTQAQGRARAAASGRQQSRGRRNRPAAAADLYDSLGTLTNRITWTANPDDDEQDYVDSQSASSSFSEASSAEEEADCVDNHHEGEDSDVVIVDDGASPEAAPSRGRGAGNGRGRRGAAPRGQSGRRRSAVVGGPEMAGGAGGLRPAGRVGEDAQGGRKEQGAPGGCAQQAEEEEEHWANPAGARATATVSRGGARQSSARAAPQASRGTAEATASGVPATAIPAGASSQPALTSAASSLPAHSSAAMSAGSEGTSLPSSPRAAAHTHRSRIVNLNTPQFPPISRVASRSSLTLGGSGSSYRGPPGGDVDDMPLARRVRRVPLSGSPGGNIDEIPLAGMLAASRALIDRQVPGYADEAVVGNHRSHWRDIQAGLRDFNDPPPPAPARGGRDRAIHAHARNVAAGDARQTAARQREAVIAAAATAVAAGVGSHLPRGVATAPGGALTGRTPLERAIFAKAQADAAAAGASGSGRPSALGSGALGAGPSGASGSAAGAGGPVLGRFAASGAGGLGAGRSATRGAGASGSGSPVPRRADPPGEVLSAWDRLEQARRINPVGQSSRPAARAPASRLNSTRMDTHNQRDLNLLEQAASPGPRATATARPATTSLALTDDQHDLQLLEQAFGPASRASEPPTSKARPQQAPPPPPNGAAANCSLPIPVMRPSHLLMGPSHLPLTSKGAAANCSLPIPVMGPSHLHGAAANCSQPTSLANPPRSVPATNLTDNLPWLAKLGVQPKPSHPQATGGPAQAKPPPSQANRLSSPSNATPKPSQLEGGPSSIAQSSEGAKPSADGSKPPPTDSSQPPPAAKAKSSHADRFQQSRADRGKPSQEHMVHSPPRVNLKQQAFGAVRSFIKPIFESGRLSKEGYKSVAKAATHSLVESITQGALSEMVLDASLGCMAVQDAVEEAMARPPE